MQYFILFTIFLICQTSKSYCNPEEMINEIQKKVKIIDSWAIQVEQYVKGVEAHLNQMKDFGFNLNEYIKNNKNYINQMNDWKTVIKNSFYKVKNDVLILNQKAENKLKKLKEQEKSTVNLHLLNMLTERVNKIEVIQNNQIDQNLNDRINEFQTKINLVKQEIEETQINQIETEIENVQNELETNQNSIKKLIHKDIEYVKNKLKMIENNNINQLKIDTLDKVKKLIENSENKNGEEQILKKDLSKSKEFKILKSETTFSKYKYLIIFGVVLLMNALIAMIYILKKNKVSSKLYEY